jgi:hypothetical protein
MNWNILLELEVDFQNIDAPISKSKYNRTFRTKINSSHAMVSSESWILGLPGSGGNWK